MKPSPFTVISLGGSLIVPDQIDTDFLQKFTDLIHARLKEGERFVIVTGGGKTARIYRDAAGALGDLVTEDLDWIGIHATRLNGHLMRTVLREHAYPVIVKDPTRRIPKKYPVVIAAGWKPGWSTDYVAVRIAKNIGAKRMINLSNIDYVYTADPKKDPAATPIEKSNWKDFRAILPPSWDPGLNAPFDPVAAKEAEKLKLEVAIVNGKNLEAVSDYLSGKSFKGTVIS